MFSYQYQQCLSSSPTPSPKTYPSSTFFPFSPPTFLNEGLHDLLLASTLLPTPNVPPSPPKPPSPATASPPPARTNSLPASGSNTRKRAMRKDRHSKIFTAQGPRDRRMRLSLEVAREFFDLQDMLGFDKASKTVKWLLTISSTAIKDLATTISRPRDHLLSESSTSECENISTVSDSKAKVQLHKPNPAKAKRVANRKPALRPVLAKESRAMARARARDRTRDKKMSQPGALQGDNGHEASQHPASSIPLDTIGDESGSHEQMSSLEPPPAAAIEEKCSSQGRQFPGGINHNNFTGNTDTLSWFREHCELNLLVNVQGRLLNDAQQQSQLYQNLSYL